MHTNGHAQMLQILRCVILKPSAWPFLEPVDPVALGVPGNASLPCLFVLQLVSFISILRRGDIQAADT
jgi:hypothetical protein